MGKWRKSRVCAPSLPLGNCHRTQQKREALAPPSTALTIPGWSTATQKGEAVAPGAASDSWDNSDRGAGSDTQTS